VAQRRTLKIILSLLFVLSFPAFANQICLTMIVRNESRIIERCLNSVAHLVDCVSICDTGSTDNTVEIIERFLKEKKIPGKVVRHEWKNFGVNRSRSIEAAQELLHTLNIPLETTWLLLLDADMVLEVLPQFRKKALCSDSYLFMQKSHFSTYYNTRLVRASMPWKCVGVTHEYWACKEALSQDTLKELVIDDREDGGCKEDKLQRDLKLLVQGLIEEPENVRYMFYLAQTLMGLNRYKEAIDCYKKRIHMGGWKEELWYSRLMIAECYQTLNQWNEALSWYLEAYNTSPSRAEPLQKISSYYRQTNQHSLAHLFASHGVKIPYPEEDLLFVSHDVYNYQFDEELSISAWYTPFREEGFRAANNLLLGLTVPPHVKEVTSKNILFYVQNLKTSQFQPIALERPLVREGLLERYRPMNPSIQRVEEGYEVICRTVNFLLNKGEYKTLDPNDDKIRTRNFLLRYDKEFNLLSQQEIVEDLPREHLPTRIQGLEDCRLFNMGGCRWCISTTADTHPDNIAQSLCQLAVQSTHETIKVQKLIPLKEPSPKRCEKNWLPWVAEGKLYTIYSWSPFVMHQIDLEKGECKTAIEYTPPWDFSRFRGSAAPIPFDGGFLVLIHEVVDFKDGGRCYTHRFVYLDSHFVIKKVSLPFTFMHQGVEYCCGMALSHDEKECILTIGIEDREAYFCSASVKEIREMLDPICYK